MEITVDQKHQIRTNIIDDLKRRQGQDKSYSQTNHAAFLDINVSTYNRVLNGDIDRVLSVTEWVRVAKRLYVDINNIGWKTVSTRVYDYVSRQIEKCQEEGLSAFNMDIVGIGKTHAAEQYARGHMNAFYIKCSVGITRANLLRTLAMNMGLDNSGRIDEVRQRVNICLTGLKRPIVVIDDAGYLNDNCWMEIKGLYDENEYECGWYIIGDTSLKKKMMNFLQKDRLGWVALFDRFNGKFQGITYGLPDADVSIMLREQMRQILEGNMPKATAQEKTEIINAAKLSLRVLRKEINKRKTNGKLQLSHAA